ncbi:MAG: sugar phosphate nucleotidyltransferase, partial [Mariprofundaceae bacterium]|nr:sugar phosphate nucleotidyltransferase [Mariprofundaceae bacterium]
MSKVTRAIILAAGLGTRLKSLTQNQPKALMLVAGEPAIVHVI